MALARRRQIAVVERAIHPEELDRTQEVFIVGTAAEVTPIRQIAERHFTPGRMTETLLRDYDALVRMPPDEVTAHINA
jgi:branched-chain amino acid aminotransferase